MTKLNMFFSVFIFLLFAITACTAEPTPISKPTAPPETATLAISSIPSPTSTRVPSPIRTRTTVANPNPTATPWASPVGVTFDFDAGISVLHKGAIQDGIAIGQSAFGEAGQITIYARTNLDELMVIFHRHEKVSAQDQFAINIRRIFENGPSMGISMVSGAIYLYITDRLLNMPRAEQMRGAAHEYFHQVQYALSGRKWQGAQAPTWLLKGCAQYLTLRVFVDHQFREAERARDIGKDMVWGLHSQLTALETPDPSEDARATYDLGYLASDFLATNYGESSISRKFWETRAVTRSWQEAFRVTFGIAVEDFYENFDEYRRTNFPSYCDPGGDQAKLALRLERQLSPGSFHGFPTNYIPYVFCVAGTRVGIWTSAQKEAAFKKPNGIADAQINYCGGNCVVLGIRPDALSGMYTFGIETPDGRKAETIFSRQDSANCFEIDGRSNDWQKINPTILDTANPSIPRAADIREVYTATCRGALYLLIVTDGRADAATKVQYAFDVDLNGDAKPEYQAGFDHMRAWIWNLKGTGYFDQNRNQTFLSSNNFKVAIGSGAELMISLTELEISTGSSIRAYTVVGGQIANTRTDWAGVPAFEQ